MLLDLAARDHVNCSLYGIVAIHDMTGVQFGHALQMSPSIVKRLVHTWQAYPNRIRSLDYVHAPTHVNVVLNLFRQFMSKKLKERMHVHTGDGRTILQKISPCLLPPELGGTEDDYESLTSKDFFYFFSILFNLILINFMLLGKKFFSKIFKANVEWIFLKSPSEETTDTRYFLVYYEINYVIYVEFSEYWKQKAEENKQWFLEDEKYKLKT